MGININEAQHGINFVNIGNKLNIIEWVIQQHIIIIKPSDLHMLDEDDQFYKELPFTLTADQAKPNFVIFGTGLQQCLLAAHFSKIQMKPGLILDMDKTYGSCLKTVTIKELHALSTKKAKINLYQFLDVPQFQQNNLAFYNKLLQEKAYRGYNIDLEPNFFFGSSITCQMLKEADMDKYMDFRIVYNMLHYDGKAFKNVPLSKGKIFESKDLGLLEKKLLLNTFHSLSQIYNKYMKVEEDQNSTKQFDKQFGQVDQKLYAQFLADKDKQFIGFLSKLTKNNQKIMNYIIYILCNYQYNYKKQLPNHAKKDYTVGQFIRRFGKFVKSCGIYGEGPYLYVDNGIGDVPQAYSRIASIYLSTYILHPKIEINKIQAADGQAVKIYTNLYPQGCVQTKHVYYGPTCYNLKFSEQTEYQREFTLRVIFLCEKLNMQQDCPSIVYLVDIKQCQNPVYLFMLDYVSHTCPEHLMLYQFETVIENKQAQKCMAKVNSFLDVLKSTRGQNFSASIKYVSAYIRQKRYPKTDNKNSQANQTILRDHTGIDLDSHFINFKSTVGDQPSYFRKEGQPNQQGEGQWNQVQDQTTGLIQKLQAIDINKQHNAQLQPQQQQEVEQEEDQIAPSNQNYAQQVQNKVQQVKQIQEKIENMAQSKKQENKEQTVKQTEQKNHIDQKVTISRQPEEGYLTHIQ